MAKKNPKEMATAPTVFRSTFSSRGMELMESRGITAHLRGCGNWAQAALQVLERTEWLNDPKPSPYSPNQVGSLVRGKATFRLFAKDETNQANAFASSRWD